MAINYVNGVPLTRENIAFIKSVQKKDKEAKVATLQRKVASIKNFEPKSSADIKAQPNFAAPVAKAKKSHAQRKAEIVARSIASDPKKNQGFHDRRAVK